jgi:hypothetical protein
MNRSLILSDREREFLLMGLARLELSKLEFSKWLEEPYGRVLGYIKRQRPVPIETRFKMIEVLEIAPEVALRVKFIPEGKADENQKFSQV